MESPEGDRIKAASTTPFSSPAVQVQDSPFTNFVSNLSPIKSDKASQYAQGFSETNFPTPPPVFRTPRLDLQRETSFLKSKEIDAAGTDVYGDCGIRLNPTFIPCSTKEFQSSSPSGFIDQYLTEPGEVEVCKNSEGLCVQPANNMCKLSRYSLTAPMVTSTKVDDANDRNSEDITLMLSDPAEIDPLRSLVPFETALGSQELSPKESAQQAESNTFLLSSAHHEQHGSQNIKLQNGGVQQNGQDGSCQSPKSLWHVEASEDSTEGLGIVSKGSFNESSSYLRGIRRHLQFEAAMAYNNATTCKGHASNDVTQEIDNSTFPVRLTDLESLISYDIESREASSRREATCYSQNIASGPSFCQSEFVSSNQYGGSITLSDRIPSGIAFHLNCTVGSLSMGSDLIPSKELPGYMSSQDDRVIPEGSSHIEQDSNNSLISSVAGKLHARFDNDQQDDQAGVGATSATTKYTDRIKLMCDSLQALSEQQEDAAEGMMLTSQNSERCEELNQVSPKKKRKKATYNSEGESCKRCNCRRSKCLKLYCECFAAGVYCIDSCACENCFNKPEYEETVLDMRQQIESRNPLAFAPKIVSRATDSLANVVEEGNWTTPASARHKRGCNCKKSKCLKKYCECFQANVGCSDGCRCEGCNNSFGKKTESKFRRVERWENQSHVKLDEAETVTDRSKAGTIKQFSPRWEDLPDISHLTPLSHPFSGAEASSASPNTRDCPKVPRPQLLQRNSFKSSAVHSHWPRSLSKEDDMPEILKETSTPTKATKVSSPHQKRVSPPQYQSQELRSSSSRGLRSGHKFILPAVPSFPPLTPYSKSKEDVGQTESDFKGDTNDN